MVVGYKSQWKFFQCNAAKPDKHHIKSFGLVDSVTGYVLDILTYFGHNTSCNLECNPGSGIAMMVFDTLLANVGRCHHVFADRWYTTRILIDHSRSQYFTGTVQINRKYFPAELKAQPLVHMEACFHKTTDNKLLFVGCKDKKTRKQLASFLIAQRLKWWRPVVEGQSHLPSICTTST
ncbi:hypothetical protein PoB_000062500 [Plakobranchus ocellatus]|uniref:PiggyBac transposable element-derived protein domain-containing protein n=1 Tax=Plakobranchus ocellatus TaxID=259542 RepID=A0AAV3XT17_9GAST|nr:hypothetical protein PoB_000062500 [Plakobranchus ocellatus]